MKKIKLSQFAGILISLFFPAIVVYAVVQTLNGQSGQVQSFANDTNVTISSTNDTHMLGWSGILGISRGGTGTSTFQDGGLIFFDGTKLTQDNEVFWDSTNNKLGIGTTSPYGKLSINGTTGTEEGGLIVASSISGSSYGGIYSTGTDINMFVKDIGGDDSSLNFQVLSSAGTVDTQLIISGINGFFFSGTTTLGTLYVTNDINPTAYIGSTIKSGCLVLGDSDGVGVTYITANNGILTATTSKPGICQ